MGKLKMVLFVIATMKNHSNTKEKRTDSSSSSLAGPHDTQPSDIQWNVTQRKVVYFKYLLVYRYLDSLPTNTNE